MNDQRHNKEYNTSAATAEPLDSEDSLTSNLLYDDVTARSNCSSNNNNKKIVIIEGLELLGIDTDGEYEYDEYDNEDERKEEEKEEYHYENYGECSSELDSLVLARKRLHHIWINHPERHHWNRRVFPHEKVSLQETSTSIPDLEPIDLGTSSSAEGKDDGNKKPNDEDDDDDDDYSWDALSQMTVDSLILTRKRFAAQRARRYRTTRKQGTDLIFLMPTTNYNNKKKKNSGIATGGNHHLQSRRIVTTKKPQVVRMARILRSHRCRTSPSVLLRTHSDTLIRLAQQQGRGGGGGTVAGAASELQRSTSYHSRSPSRTSSFSSFTGDNNNRRH